MGALLLLLSATPAFAAPFDGVWQSVGHEGGYSRFTIHGDEVHHLIERDGKFIEERSCWFGIERKVRSAYISFLECSADDGTLLVITDRYLLTKRDKNTLRVRTEKRNGRLEEDSDWVRVE